MSQRREKTKPDQSQHVNQPATKADINRLCQQNLKLTQQIKDLHNELKKM